MNNVYGYTLQGILRHTKVPNYVKIITWLFQRIPLGDVLSKRVQSATASGGVRCGKHAIGTPNDGTAFVMNSKGS